MSAFSYPIIREKNGGRKRPTKTENWYDSSVSTKALSVHAAVVFASILVNCIGFSNCQDGACLHKIKAADLRAIFDMIK